MAGITQLAHGRAGIQSQAARLWNEHSHLSWAGISTPTTLPLRSLASSPEGAHPTWGLCTCCFLCQEYSPFTGSFLVSFTSLFKCHLLFSFPPKSLPCPPPVFHPHSVFIFLLARVPFSHTVFYLFICSLSVPPTRMQAPRGQGFSFLFTVLLPT